jgi:Zn-dependent peptidase ImmA (M78 family)
MDDTGCRIWNQDVEDEASWLAGCLLVTEAAALAVGRGSISLSEAAARLGVSEQMVRFRVNMSGARKRAGKAAARRPLKARGA